MIRLMKKEKKEGPIKEQRMRPLVPCGPLFREHFPSAGRTIKGNNQTFWSEYRGDQECIKEAYREKWT